MRNFYVDVVDAEDPSDLASKLEDLLQTECSDNPACKVLSQVLVPAAEPGHICVLVTFEVTKDG